MKNRYQGRGGRYVRVGDEVFPAAEDGITPAPHDESIPDVADDAVPAPAEPAGGDAPQADPTPTE
jgi:hypothetical protein